LRVTTWTNTLLSGANLKEAQFNSANLFGADLTLLWRHLSRGAWLTEAGG
jgi:uncharacterized protein YjbI with pentapeptide repeats